MTGTYKYLFTPLKIGPITVPNRIYLPPHGNNLTDHDPPYYITGDREAIYLAERAKGGAGLIIHGASAVHYMAGYTTGNFFPHAYREEVIPRYKVMSDMIHQYGAKVFIQLIHTGMHSTGMDQDDYHVVWAASVIPGLGTNRDYGLAKEMEVEDIKEVVKGFAISARNAKEGGLDGIEIHSTHSYMVQQFLSPLTNKREDEYGGSLENRMRLLLEIIEAVRNEVGSDMAVGVRIAGDEFTPGGLTAVDVQEVCRRLEATQKIDYISVTAGGHWTRESAVCVVAPSAIPPGFLVPLAAAIKNEVKTIPIMCAGRITDPALAEKILAEGQADMIGMCRALICDPELPNKAKEDRTEEIRSCVGCMQGCIDRVTRGSVVGCVQNPVAGREHRTEPLKPASTKKKVLVIGGGPGGLKAAEIAAMRGHKVVIYEKEKELGGQVKLAAKTPLRTEFGGIADFLIKRIGKLGVEVKTGQEATLGVVQKEAPDVVIVATGCQAVRTRFNQRELVEESIPGVEQPNVVTIFDVLNESVEIGQNVVMVDDLRSYHTLSIADLLAGRGKQVEVITQWGFPISERIHTLDAGLLLRGLREKGVKLTTRTRVRSISGSKVVVSDLGGRDEREIEGVDTIVWATGFKANDELYFKLKGNVKELYRVGDCVAPRFVEFAIHEGEQIGRSI